MSKKIILLNIMLLMTYGCSEKKNQEEKHQQLNNKEKIIEIEENQYKLTIPEDKIISHKPIENETLFKTFEPNQISTVELYKITSSVLEWLNPNLLDSWIPTKIAKANPEMLSGGSFYNELKVVKGPFYISLNIKTKNLSLFLEEYVCLKCEDVKIVQSSDFSKVNGMKLLLKDHINTLSESIKEPMYPLKFKFDNSVILIWTEKLMQDFDQLDAEIISNPSIIIDEGFFILLLKTLRQDSSYMIIS